MIVITVLICTSSIKPKGKSLIIRTDLLSNITKRSSNLANNDEINLIPINSKIRKLNPAYIINVAAGITIRFETRKYTGNCVKYSNPKGKVANCAAIETAVIAHALSKIQNRSFGLIRL